MFRDGLRCIVVFETTPPLVHPNLSPTLSGIFRNPVRHVRRSARARRLYQPIKETEGGRLYQSTKEPEEAVPEGAVQNSK